MGSSVETHRQGWIGCHATYPYQQIGRRGVQIETKEVGHVAVIAESVGLESTLQFFVAVFAFTALGILVISSRGKHRPRDDW